jgi:hypothetical protein
VLVSEGSTAFDRAGTGSANPESMVEGSRTELELAEPGPTRAVTRGFFIAPAKGLPVRIRPPLVLRATA